MFYISVALQGVSCFLSCQDIKFYHHVSHDIWCVHEHVCTRVRVEPCDRYNM
jgi:hypothetical protein